MRQGEGVSDGNLVILLSFLREAIESKNTANILAHLGHGGQKGR